MRNDIIMALTDLNARVSFGGGGGSGSGGRGGQTRNQRDAAVAGSKNTTTVNKTRGQTVNRDGKGDREDRNNNYDNKNKWSGCGNVNIGIVGGEVCYGK